jgi:uncharacterized protein DUF1566
MAGAVSPTLKQCQSNLNTCNADLAACQASSQTFPGDGYGNPDSSGVSGHGPALSYTNNGDGTFTDNNTKFMWEIKTNVTGSVHNVGNTYTWTSGGVTTPNGTLFTDFLHKLNNTCAGDETKSCTSDDDCTVANGGPGGPCGFAGHRDWCIPNVKQLQSIVDYSKSSPASSVPGATDTTFYWSATSTFESITTDAWGVDFSDGIVSIDSKSNGVQARAVRPCP